MIPIEKSDEEKVRQLCEKLYKKLDSKEEINKFLRQNKNEYSEFDNPFLEIMKADYSKLKKLKELASLDVLKEDEKKHLREVLIKNYEKIDSKLRKEIIDLKEIKVCPYCNRNYIYSTFKTLVCGQCGNELFLDEKKDKVCPTCVRTIRGEKSGQIKVVNTAQLDHFFSKADYPLFVVSFYNLIPSCYSCNHVKSETELKYSPYDTDFSFSDVKFSYDLEAVDKLKIKIKSTDEDYKKDLHELGIEALYQNHIDIVEELNTKQEIYSKVYKDGLTEILRENGIKLSNSEIDRMIVGSYTIEKDYGKRPLSKMITDISKEIGLIGEK